MNEKGVCVCVYTYIHKFELYLSYEKAQNFSRGIVGIFG